MISVVEVSKWFGDLVAVSEVTFSIGPGVTALLGPNGAGKSTMLRMLCGLTAASRGTIRVLGADPKCDRSVARQIGLVPQQSSLFENLTALDFVGLAAVLHHLPDAAAQAAAALRTVALDPDDTRPLSTYSKGMRQRVKVAQALVHDPSVVVLDEPLAGLDPRQRIEMVELFRDLGAQGRCVLVSSHILDEVERFGSRVLVLVQGRLAAEGDFRAIRDLMDDRPHRIRVCTDDPRSLGIGLLEAGVVIAVAIEGDDALVVDTADAPAFRLVVAPIARELGLLLTEITPFDDDLESVFRYLVGAR